MRNGRLVGFLVFSLVSLVLAGCAVKSDLRPLTVEAVSIKVGVGSPIPVEIVTSGTWPDLCAQLARAEMRIDGYKITVNLQASAEQAGCPPDFLGLPFRVAVPLNVVELPAGTYTVSAGGASTTFAWPQ
jgi:hypothetical protein